MRAKNSCLFYNHIPIKTWSWFIKEPLRYPTPIFYSLEQAALKEIKLMQSYCWKKSQSHILIFTNSNVQWSFRHAQLSGLQSKLILVDDAIYRGNLIVSFYPNFEEFNLFVIWLRLMRELLSVKGLSNEQSEQLIIWN